MFGTAKRRNEIRTETACHTVSIEACRAYKPSAHVYHYVSQKLGGLSMHDGRRRRLGHRRSPERRLQFSVDHPPRQCAADRPRPPQPNIVIPDLEALGRGLPASETMP